MKSKKERDWEIRIRKWINYPNHRVVTAAECVPFDCKRVRVFILPVANQIFRARSESIDWRGSRTNRWRFGCWNDILLCMCSIDRRSRSRRRQSIAGLLSNNHHFRTRRDFPSIQSRPEVSSIDLVENDKRVFRRATW